VPLCPQAIDYIDAQVDGLLPEVLPGATNLHTLHLPWVSIHEAETLEALLSHPSLTHLEVGFSDRPSCNHGRSAWHTVSCVVLKWFEDSRGKVCCACLPTR
jgi:hypothetical protein